MSTAVRTLLVAVFLLAFAFAHETQLVGEAGAQYKVIVGYAKEPAYTDERNGLTLIVRTADDQPVANLENSLSATLVAPDGSTRRLALRAVHGQPGSYTDDFILTLPGGYQLLVTGFVGATELDLTFSMHDVRPLTELRFP